MNIFDIRRDFPYFDNKSMPIYMDNAATTQKPQQVLNRMLQFYTYECSNIHRGGYPLANNTTQAYEQARETIASFIGAKAEQIAFTMNATDALNQAISITASASFGQGKNVLTTMLEHHSAFLPLQKACHDTNTELRLLPIDEDGIPDLTALEYLMDENTVCAVLTLGANSTGYALPWQQILPNLIDKNICIILDATQRIVHESLNVQHLGCDFLCFSGHKLYGPTGIGVLYINDNWNQKGLGRLGGGMVDSVTKHNFIRIPNASALEAGTPPIAQALGLEAAIEYLNNIDLQALHNYENKLHIQLRHGLSAIPGIRVLENSNGLPIVSFVSDSLHAIEMNKLLAMQNFALRDGRHCAHIFHDQMKLSATVRASLSFYNTECEIQALLNAVDQIQGKWRRIKT